MKAYGSVATGGTGARGIDVPTEPRPSGRTIVGDLATRGSGRTSPIGAPVAPSSHRRVPVDYADPARDANRKAAAGKAGRAAAADAARRRRDATRTQRDRVIAAHLAGRTAAQAAEAGGVAKATAARWLREAADDRITDSGADLSHIRAWAAARGVTIPATWPIPLRAVAGYLAERDAYARREAAR